MVHPKRKTTKRVLSRVLGGFIRSTDGTSAIRQHQNSMLVPLVFLILPVTIVFALFPATLVLELGF